MSGLCRCFESSPVPAFGGAALAVLLLAVSAGWLWRAPERREPEVAFEPDAFVPTFAFIAARVRRRHQHRNAPS